MQELNQYGKGLIPWRHHAHAQTGFTDLLSCCHSIFQGIKPLPS